MVSVCRKHEVSPAPYFNWKKIFDLHGEAGFQQDKSAQDQLCKKLEEENRRLIHWSLEKIPSWGKAFSN